MLVRIYDDRGIAIHSNNIKKLYKDYNRETIDEVFL